jgi:hypothetical protein
LRAEAYEKDGEARVGLTVLADAVLAAGEEAADEPSTRRAEAEIFSVIRVIDNRVASVALPAAFQPLGVTCRTGPAGR